MSERSQRPPAHILTITPGADSTPEDPEWSFDLECESGGNCGWWIECTEDHTGYDPEDEESAAYDEWEGVEIHGVLHEWQWGYGWTGPIAPRRGAGDSSRCGGCSSRCCCWSAGTSGCVGAAHWLTPSWPCTTTITSCGRPGAARSSGATGWVMVHHSLDGREPLE